MQFGRFTVSLHNFGFFALDGGAMFGSVPKTIWEKLIVPDAQNRIRLATRSLILSDQRRTFLVDTGCGDKWSEKLRGIYAIEPYEHLAAPSASKITDVILTHLHFDHAGGISRLNAESKPTLSYPAAKIYLQLANLHNARQPSPKERASYLAENVDVLLDADVDLIDGQREIAPDLLVHRVDGHTIGQQWVELRAAEISLIFATDLIPTSHHLPLPYHMGYDQCAATLLREKEEFLTYAEERRAIVVFQHDPLVPAARIGRNKKGHFEVTEHVVI